jgi:16S rRNA (guanine527-N7)-methyltransferase
VPKTVQATHLTEEQIRKLLAPFLGRDHISPTQLAQVSTYLNLLLKWNSKINLTAVRDVEEIVSRHFGESFFAARHLFPDNSVTASVIDIGSGAGFPGLPLKIWAAGCELTLVEANRKKMAFLREVIRAIGLSGVSAVAVRAEDLEAEVDLVTLRAVERFEDILPVALSLARPGGRVALLIGEDQLETAASRLPSFARDTPVRIPLSHNRVLAVASTSF